MRSQLQPLCGTVALCVWMVGIWIGIMLPSRLMAEMIAQTMIAETVTDNCFRVEARKIVFGDSAFFRIQNPSDLFG